MEKHLLNGPWAEALKREWRLRHLSDPAYRFLFEAPPTNEWVAITCATTGHNTQEDEILSVNAVRIQDHRVMCSERLELLIKPLKPVPATALRTHLLREQDLMQGLPKQEAMRHLLHYMGSRPLVGYFLSFDVDMINRLVRPLIGIGLPNETIDVSSLYYSWAFQRLPPYQQQNNQAIDLRFASMLEALDLPVRDSHSSADNVVQTALSFIKLRTLKNK